MQLVPSLYWDRELFLCLLEWVMFLPLASMPAYGAKYSPWFEARISQHCNAPCTCPTQPVTFHPRSLFCSCSHWGCALGPVCSSIPSISLHSLWEFFWCLSVEFPFLDFMSFSFWYSVSSSGFLRKGSSEINFWDLHCLKMPFPPSQLSDRLPGYWI